MDGIAGVQARIQEIIGQFSAPAPSASGTVDLMALGGDSNFSATLARVQEGASTATSTLTATEAPAGTGEVNRAGVDPAQWAHDFLTRLGMPTTSENMRVMQAWQQAEGTSANFNPLATCQGYPNATQFNSVGVKNYATYTDGLVATIKGIRNGRYGNILAALQRGNSATAVAQAIADSPWGSGNLVLEILQQQSAA